MKDALYCLFPPDQSATKRCRFFASTQVSQLAVDIGEVLFAPIPHSPPVTLRTVVGTHRVLDLLSGEQLPRIC